MEDDPFDQAAQVLARTFRRDVSRTRYHFMRNLYGGCSIVHRRFPLAPEESSQLVPLENWKIPEAFFRLKLQPFSRMSNATDFVSGNALSS